MKPHRVFLSYRRGDDPFGALYIDEGLARHFGREQVFRDSASIEAGARFPTRIAEALWRCEVLLAVIGRNWLGSGDNAIRRIDDPHDYVRYEVGVALQRAIPVVPVRLEDAPVPDFDALPADIAGLATCQYRDFRVRNAEYDLARLIADLTTLLGGTKTGSGLRVEPGPVAQPPAVSVTRIDLQGPVDARHSVFGNHYTAR